MLLSLLKILFFFAVVLALTLGAIQLSETGQYLRLEYAGTEMVLTPLKAAVVLAVLVVLAWLLVKLLGLALAFVRFLAGDETAISRYFARSRERKGYQAVADAVLAIASGEGKLAQDKAAKAEKYLQKPHITNLLSAQAAEVAGDTQKAGQIYRELLSDDRTRFVGVRGLLRQKLEDGDTATALLLAQKAYALKPKHKEIQDTLLSLEMREHDWKGARQMLKEKRRQGELPQDVHLRRDAVLALTEASEVLAKGNSISAREAAISAAKASPDLIPAAALAARSYIAQKDFRNASRLLEKTWSVRPHPDIAAVYAEITPDETPAARLKRFDRLIAKNPENEESRLLKAELLLAAEDFPGARRALGDLAEKHPTVRTLSIMAAIERGEGSDDSVVRGYLARALTASRGPQWCCDKCHNIMADWAPVCDSCGGFDTLTWREPDEKRSGAAMSGTGAEMLPLLIGTPKPAPAPVEEAQTITPDRPDAAPRPARPEPELAEAELTAPPPKPKPEPTPAVAPGMVPREADYNEPSSTITTAEPPRAAPRPAAPAPAAETPQPAPVPEPAASAPAQPAVEKPVPPAKTAPATPPVSANVASKPEPEPELEREMVRPDVVPPEEADWTEGKIRP
ncbi:heme biosynthesis protein HemY [Paracoccus caeni]|uniref:Heme biosynthesis protein HemY n=1 Tax=Paracoccus caeni TaxID=657651 RepID=A0A934VTG4_9RHOB|nr:heme biosynthesis HemY N-terminal domain-containing protein [Paracoccus caeni]MBK4214696.1 heme biosynthesis protein HemY [Paracoccus caeni]